MSTRQQSRRTILMLAGLLPAVLALVVLAKVVVMMANDEEGRASFADAEFTPAAESFGANHRWNWFEPWIAPFDEGTARHADGAYDDAVDLYEDALASVPPVEECTVRINLALAHEALGDRAAEGPPPDPDRAATHWQAGLDALLEGGCPDESGRGEEQTQRAADVEARLREKLEQQQQQQNPQQQPDQQQDPQEQDLEERNDEGREERRDQQEGGGEGDRRGEGQEEDDEERGGGAGPQGGSGGTPTPAW